MAATNVSFSSSTSLQDEVCWLRRHSPYDTQAMKHSALLQITGEVHSNQNKTGHTLESRSNTGDECMYTELHRSLEICELLQFCLSQEFSMMQCKLIIHKEKCDTIAVFIRHSRSTAEGMSGRGKEEGHGGEK